MRVAIAMLWFLLGVGAAAAFGLARPPAGHGRPAEARDRGPTVAGPDEVGTPGVAKEARARAQSRDEDVAAGQADAALVARAAALVAAARALPLPGRGDLADPVCGGHTCLVRIPASMAPSLRPWLEQGRPDVFVRPPADGRGDGSVLVYLMAAEDDGQ